MMNSRSPDFKPLVHTVAWAAAIIAVAVVFMSRSVDSVADRQTIWFDGDGRPAVYADVVDAVRMADVAVLGEIHDNPHHHLAQARLLEAMIAGGKRPAVIWEMVDRDRQPAIDRMFADGPPDPDMFAEAVDWRKSGWPAWSMYRPIAEAALRERLPMMAGDLDRAAMESVMASGVGAALPEATAMWPVDQVYGKAAEAAQLDALFRGHCERVPRDRLRPMLSAQYARDMSLALAVMDAVDKHGSAVLITGNGHARRDIAVPMLLARVRPSIRVVSVGMQESDARQGEAAVAEPYDFVGSSPSVERPDPCEGLPDRMGGAD